MLTLFYNDPEVIFDSVLEDRRGTWEIPLNGNNTHTHTHKKENNFPISN